MAESYVALNRKLFACIEGEECGQAVLDILLPNDCALDTEDALWDYKEALPTTHSDPHVSKQDKNVHAYLAGQLVRTIVSFYNAFGGYVVAGVDDKSRAITGFSSPINVDDLRKKIESATGQEIRFVYQRHKRTIAQNVTVGLL